MHRRLFTPCASEALADFLGGEAGWDADIVEAGDLHLGELGTRAASPPPCAQTPSAITRAIWCSGRGRAVSGKYGNLKPEDSEIGELVIAERRQLGYGVLVAPPCLDHGAARLPNLRIN